MQKQSLPLVIFQSKFRNRGSLGSRLIRCGYPPEVFQPAS
jgi:hypothetical protein